MRLVRIVDRSFPPGPRIFETTYADGVHIGCDLRDAVQSSIFYRGFYERRVTELFLAELRPGDKVLDLGANVGYFTLLAARAVGSNGTVHAFEPSRDLAKRLEDDARQNGFANVVVHKYAASDCAGGGLLAESLDAGAPAGGRFVTAVGGANSGEAIEIVAIDSHLPDATFDVVKIDIEGAELRAIRGMEGAILRSRPRLMLIEAIEDNLHRFGDSVADLYRTMEELGYHGTLITEDYFADMVAFRPIAPCAGT